MEHTRQFLVSVRWEQPIGSNALTVDRDAIEDQLTHSWSDAVEGNLWVTAQLVSPAQNGCASVESTPPKCPKCDGAMFVEIGSAPSTRRFNWDAKAEEFYWHEARTGDAHGEEWECANCATPLDVDIASGVVTLKGADQ